MKAFFLIVALFLVRSAMVNSAWQTTTTKTSADRPVDTLPKDIRACKNHYLGNNKHKDVMAEESPETYNLPKDKPIDKCRETSPVKSMWIGISKNGNTSEKKEKDALQWGQAFIDYGDRVEGLIFPVSTGLANETPTGKLVPARLEQNHCTGEFDNRPMPYSIFLARRGPPTDEDKKYGNVIDRGIAIHQGYEVTGYPTSKGCIRVLNDHADIQKLFCAVQSLDKQGKKDTVEIEISADNVELPGKWKPYEKLLADQNEKGGYDRTLDNRGRRKDRPDIFTNPFGVAP